MPQDGEHRGGGPWCALALLVLAPMVRAGAAGAVECEEQAVAANGMLELVPKAPLREWTSVRWRLGLEAESYQLILVAERNGAASILRSPLSGRAVFQQEPLSLRIGPVLAADAGLYEAEFEDAGGDVRSRCFRVRVWEPLRPPHVESRVEPEARGWCRLSLLCTAAGAVSYSWACSGDAAGTLEPGPRLQRRLRADADPIVCRCNVSNAGSWSSASASISASCRAAAAGFVLGWAVAVAVAVLALLIAIALAITCYCRRKRGKDPPGGHIEQALTVYEEVGKAQRGQDPRATGNEAASGENTIYAVICKAQGPSLPREPESRTVYSSLQPIRKSPSLRRKRLDPALISTAYAEVTGCPRRPPSQIVPPAPTGHHLS